MMKRDAQLGRYGGILLLVGVVAGCASRPSMGSDALDKAPLDNPQGAGIEQAEEAAARWRLADFEGGQRAAWEALVGPPALTRREGDGLFLRYDLGSCRIYGFVRQSDEEEIIQNLSLLSAERGQPSPAFESCLAAGA